MKRIDPKTETAIIARLARGDTYEAIRADLESEGTNVTISNISAVRSRNKQALDYIRGELTKHEVRISTKLLSKSHQLLDRKLNRALSQEATIKKLQEQFHAGEIEDFEFERLLNAAIKTELTTSELIAIAKEMFNQSQIEQNKPTSISDNPTQAKENLKTLLEAINRKDEKAIIEAIFTDVEPKPVP